MKSKVDRVVVHRSRTFNHENEEYSNVRIGVTLEATKSDEEDLGAVYDSLMASADLAVAGEEERIRNRWREEAKKEDGKWEAKRKARIMVQKLREAGLKDKDVAEAMGYGDDDIPF